MACIEEYWQVVNCDVMCEQRRLITRPISGLLILRQLKTATLSHCSRRCWTSSVLTIQSATACRTTIWCSLIHGSLSLKWHFTCYVLLLKDASQQFHLQKSSLALLMSSQPARSVMLCTVDTITIIILIEVAIFFNRGRSKLRPLYGQLSHSSSWGR